MSSKITKRPLRLGRSAKAGIKLGIFILTAACTVKIAKLGWETFQNRLGTPGGELLIFPMMILLFYAGWTAKTEWAVFKDALNGTEGGSCHAYSSNNPSYKG